MSQPLSLFRPLFRAPSSHLPGILLALVLAGAAMALSGGLGLALLSPLILAMGLGMAGRVLLGPLAAAEPGLRFARQHLLRAAIILLGFRLTLAEVGSLGLGVALAVAGTLAATFLLTRVLGRWLGVPAPLAELIAAGSAVCGASAIVACNTVTRGRDEDVAYAMACVALFGSLGMLACPVLAGPLGLDPRAYGLWTGASLHEVAQVMGAGFALGDEAGTVATLAKLFRVALLAPLVLMLGAGRRAGGTRPPMPWFVLGFLAAMVVNSLVPLPAVLLAGAAQLSAVLMAMALAALGLGTDLGQLRRRGVRPLLLAGLAALFVSGFSLLALQVLD
ncbi:YeiH family protein [Oceanicola sp. S124]|uniref:YeiH family protein n=1 Tax=Oceanicola sp. S124 TaxID=1042378 RepID=UPI00025581AF|nr:putative sulfate exporter family transporter [Oceanicola sp. S124]